MPSPPYAINVNMKIKDIDAHFWSEENTIDCHITSKQNRASIPLTQVEHWTELAWQVHRFGGESRPRERRFIPGPSDPHGPSLGLMPENSTGQSQEARILNFPARTGLYPIELLSSFAPAARPSPQAAGHGPSLECGVAKASRPI